MVTVVDVSGEITEGSVLTDAGSVTFEDVDLTDRPTATQATKSVTGLKADNSTLTLTGAQATAIANAFTISPAGGNANNGTINWDYTITEDELDFLAAGETVTAVFTITVADGHGGTDTQDVTITITGANDAPVISIGNVNGAIIEGSGDLNETGSISFTDVDLTDRPTATEATKTVTGLKADNTTELLLTNDQKTAIENSFTIASPDTNANNGEVTWDYTITEGELDFLAAGETITAVFTITVADGHGGSDTQDVTITITGTNDAPIITVVDVSGEITESSVLTDAGSVTFEDVDLTDRPTATEATKSVTGLKADNNTELLLTNEQKTAIENAFTIATPLTNTNNGEVTWDYTITEDVLDFLAAGETVTAVFTITVADGHGGSDTQDVTITITGTNDAPIIGLGVFTGKVTEIADLAGGENSTDLTVSNSFAVTDVDLTNSQSVAAVPAAAGYLGTFTPTVADQTTTDGAGTIDWTFTVADSAIDSLAEGQQLVQTYTVTVTDSAGATAEQDVTITITGTSDAPVIGLGAFTGKVTEIADLASDENSTDLTVSNSFAVTDVDLTNSLSVAAVPAAAGYLGTFTPTVADQTTTDGAGTIDWTFTVADSAIDYLAEGQQLVQTYTVTVTDTAGATATRDVTVTITGTNDAPIIGLGAFTGGVTEIADLGIGENSTDLAVSNSFAVTDVDLTNSLSVAAVPAAAGYLGTFTPTVADQTTTDGAGTIDWTFTVADSDIDYLAEGQQLVQTYTVTVTDSAGATATRDVTITITGANDAPVVTVVDVSGDITEGSVLTNNGSVTFEDVDLTDRPTATEATKSVTGLKADNNTELLLTNEQKTAIENAFTIATRLTNTNNGEVTWDYTITEGALDFLAAGETVTAVFTITVADGHGGTDRSEDGSTTTINGSNDGSGYRPAEHLCRGSHRNSRSWRR